ncbi:MAG: DUF1853 family protein [Cellvibrionaceae bacterium]|nr:DUF1853 family protein [Cellvibrionaceae bacterium]
MPSPRSSLTRFHHPLVRDLCWTLDPAFDLLTELPPYSRFLPPQEQHLLDAWLRDLESDPQPLETFINNPSLQRLGRHFERLVLFYLGHSPASPFQVLNHNLPILRVNAEGHPITLGELDFLLAGPTGRLHLEIAVKFYLGLEHSGEVHWIGPSLHDRLTRKLQHLHGHQLPLSKTLEQEPMERYFWLKGALFHPWQRTLRLPDGLLAQEPASFWLTCSQALEVLAEPADWRCVARVNWLGCDGDEADAIATPLRIHQHFATSTQALMLWNETNKSRCLIVADDWPASASAVLSNQPFATTPSRSI